MNYHKEFEVHDFMQFAPCVLRSSRSGANFESGWFKALWNTNLIQLCSFFFQFSVSGKLKDFQEKNPLFAFTEFTFCQPDSFERSPSQ